MDQFDHLSDGELVLFLRCNKTEMSCLEEPLIFLNQLSDFHLVPEDLYEKAKKARTKKSKQKYMYEILDWVDKKRWQCMKLFWTQVFQEHILQQYPLFRLYQTKLLNAAITTEQKKDGKKRKIHAEETEETEENKPGASSGSSITVAKAAKKPRTDIVTKK